MKTMVLTVLAGVLLSACAAALFMYSGIYDVSARAPDGPVLKWLLSQTTEASVGRRAKMIEVPDLESDALRLAGVNDFEAMCVGCHGAPGKKPGPIGQGLNPPPPDLQDSARRRSPAELFWVTKNGIKMTGMPAWGPTHDDEALWSVVALISALPDLDAHAYDDLIARAEGMGHHSEDDETGRGHSHEAQNDNLPEIHEQPSSGHDHSSHEH